MLEIVSKIWVECLLGQDEVELSFVSEGSPLSVDDHVTRLEIVAVPIFDLLIQIFFLSFFFIKISYDIVIFEIFLFHFFFPFTLSKSSR